PFIADHAVDGRVIVPATVHVELLLAAGRLAAGDEELAVEGVTIREALELEEGLPRSLMVRVDRAEAGGDRKVSIHSLADGEDEFRLHAEATLTVSGGELPGALDRETIEARCGEIVGSTAFYERLAERGLDFGPSFRGVGEVRYTEGEALVTLVEPAEIEGGFRLHPATLDAAIQGMAVAVPDGPGSGALYLPVEIGRVRYLNGGGPARFAHVQTRRGEGGGRTLVGSVTVYDEGGRPIATVDEIRLVPVSDRRAGGEDSPVYRIGWESRP